MNKLTTTIEGQIKQLAPKAKNISIRVEKDHDQYLAKIHMRLPGMVLHAQKKGQTMWESLNSSYDAIVKQICKFKMKERMKKKIPVWRWHDPLV